MKKMVAMIFFMQTPQGVKFPLLKAEIDRGPRFNFKTNAKDYCKKENTCPLLLPF
jgi:hypothetical protein